VKNDPETMPPNKASTECKAKLATELFERESHIDPPQGAKDPAPNTDKNFRRLYADRTVHQWCQWATMAGFVPIPAVDLLSISAVQAKMVHRLCQIYDKRFERDAISSIISGLVGGSLTGLVSAGLAFTLIKNIPVVGTTMSTLTLPAVAFGATHALGAVLIQHFENDLEISELSVKEVEQYFLDQFEKGKALFHKKKLAD
jgi:uncharacterized protein (DUF697 family)